MVIAMMAVGGVNVVVWGPHPTADTKPLKMWRFPLELKPVPSVLPHSRRMKLLNLHENIKTQKELRDRRPDHPRRSDVTTVQPAGQ